MSGFKGIAGSIVEATGLPSRIWPSPPPLQQFIDSEQLVELTLDQRSYKYDFAREYYEWIQVNESIVAAISHLPSVHVLGQGVLLRTTPGLTAMVSVAEAAFILFGDNVSELLWILVQVVERELKADTLNAPVGDSDLRWKKEISFAEHVQKTQEERERERERERESEQEWERERERKREFRVKQEETPGMKRGTRRDMDELSRFDDLIVQELHEVKQQQGSLHEKLDDVRQQNEEILRLMKEMSQKSSEADKSLPPGPEMASKLIPSIVKNPSKYYSSHFAFIGARKKDGQWFICVSKDLKGLKDELRSLIDWLGVALGGSGVGAISRIPTHYIQLEEENKALAARDRLQLDTPKETHRCWRTKILSGNILVLPRLEVAIPPRTAADEFSLGGQGFSRPFSQMEDSLILTAAALWSLFDNTLERVPNCQCTFRTASKDFIQCKSESDGWFLWHTFSNEKLCEGRDCDSNMCVALTAEETGKRLYTTSPCVLGWAVDSRTEPTSPLWETLSVTEEFRKREFVKYPVKEFQALAQLSVPVIVTPQIGGAITFSKQNYQIAHSIDHDSVLAMETAATAVVLIFDEKRRIHLLCNGADIIEILCVQYLRNIGLSKSSLPVFTHSTSLLRLQTWYHSNFVSATRKQLTGDHLIREASKRISRLTELVKGASAERNLLYWLLGDVLQGNTGHALKVPKSQQASWYKLAFKSPPLIFAVGELNAKRLTVDGFPLKWQASNSRSRLFELAEIFHSSSTPGAIVGGLEGVKRWLGKAQFFINATLRPTHDQVIFGSGASDYESTYEVVEGCQQDVSSDLISALCENCKQDGTHQCLHYIQ
jgi:hypothetical protein